MMRRKQSHAPADKVALTATRAPHPAIRRSALCLLPLALFAGAAARAEPPCYANCDGSCQSPVLNVSDFACFLNAFAGGLPYANCDASTSPPLLNVSDFACFLNQFAAGCNSLPDLTLTIDSAPCGLAPNQVFSATVTVRNIGHGCAQGPIFIGAGLSTDCIPENGNDPSVGGDTFNIDPPLRWGESRQFTLANLVAPPNPLLGTQHLIIGADTQGPLPCRALCEVSETNNFDCIVMPVAPTDIVVQDIIPPASPPISNTMTTVQVVVRNTTYGFAVNVPVTVQIGGGPVSNPVFVTLGPSCEPSGTQTVNVSVQVGPSPGDCGEADPVPITACANFPNDPTPANNCLTEQMLVVDPHWDLEVTIPTGPASAFVSGCTTCGPTSWTVSVRNNGSVASPSGVRVLSGIARFDSNPCDVTSNAFPPNARDLPSIPPGGTHQYIVSSYEILCPAFIGTQFIKAAICNTGCGTTPDLCLAGNCAAPRPIQIQLCP